MDRLTAPATRALRGRRVAARVLLALLVAATAACSPRGGSSATTTTTADPAFYDVPASAAAGAPGDIVRSQLVSQSPTTGSIWRILYRSRSAADAPVVVSGIVAVPPGTPPAGGWPVLSFAHGTVGIADACAPSRFPADTASQFTKQGFVAVATDYEGLGTPGRHPYLVGGSEARGVIDAVRAARAMGSSVQASDRYAVIGYSQGGHAALFTNQIAATYAPELHLVGTVAGAPVVELGDWLRALASSKFDFLEAFVAAGLATSDPAADPSQVLTPDAAAKLHLVDEQCATQVMDAYAPLQGHVVAHDPSTVPAFAPLVTANTPGQAAGSAPLLVVYGGADELIAGSLTQAALARICATGQAVEHRAYPGVDHAGIIQASLTDAMAWVQARLRGDAAPSTC